MMLPDAFIHQMKEQLGDESAAFFHALEQPPVRGLRWNPWKRRPSVETLLRDAECQPVPWEQHAVYLRPDSDAGLHPLHEMGAYYLQEPSAMAPVAVLQPQPGEMVLDLCAAPGGKSTQIAGRMGASGCLVANEPNPRRAQILLRNLERFGVANAVVCSETPARLLEKWPSLFDRVLVDAPCSGEGMFRRHPEAVSQWHVDMVALCARRQAEIFQAAACLLKPGGRLVYSTCTYNRDENEHVIEAFLSAHPAFSLIPFALPGLPDGQHGWAHLYPHCLAGEGHFVACLQKAGQSERTEPVDVCLPLDKACAPLWQRFVEDHFSSAIPPPLQMGTYLYLPPRIVPPLDGLSVLRVGVQAGELCRGRIEPAHALALSEYGLSMRRQYAVDLPRAVACQRGEAFPAPGAEKGFTLLTYEGVGMMFAKCADGMMKNRYPKGLRVNNRGRDAWENA